MTTLRDRRTGRAVEYLTGSGWVQRPVDLEPALDGSTTCDVAVVGGGLAGMAAALRLAERGVDVVVLEADVCGWGASARSAGYLTNTLAADPQLLSTVFRSQLPDLVRFADRAVHFAEGLMERLSIDCDYERTGIVGGATSPGQVKRARRMAESLGKAGWDSEFLPREQLGIPDTFLGGVRERIGGLLNPGKYALGVREALLGTSARVFERSPVHAVEDDGRRVTIRAPRGRVRADRVLLAANASLPELETAPRRVASPLWVTLVDTEPIAPERLDEIGWTSRSGIATLHAMLENYRLTVDNRIVFGTRMVETARGPVRGRRPNERVVADLIRGFRERFPSLDDVAPQRAWGGWVAVTSSWLPIAGAATPNVSYLIGCNGHGLSQAPFLGTVLADRLAGDDVEDLLRGVWRSRSRFAPGILASAPVIRAGWAFDRTADFVARQRADRRRARDRR